MIEDNHKPMNLLFIINDCEKFFIYGTRKVGKD